MHTCSGPYGVAFFSSGYPSASYWLLIRYYQASDRIFGGTRYARYQEAQRWEAECSKRKVAKLKEAATGVQRSEASMKRCFSKRLPIPISWQRTTKAAHERSFIFLAVTSQANASTQTAARQRSRCGISATRSARSGLRVAHRLASPTGRFGSSFSNHIRTPLHN
jgi:hypothetical protein